MNEIVRPQATVAEPMDGAKPRRNLTDLLWFAVPLIALLAAAAWLIAGDWLKAFDNGAPPVEKVTFERTILDGQGIHVKISAGG